MRIPCLETKRLILRSFTEDDTDALYLLLSDQEVNTFLPWFPVKNKAEANQFYKERLAASNKAEPPYSYAISQSGWMTATISAIRFERNFGISDWSQKQAGLLLRS